MHRSLLLLALCACTPVENNIRTLLPEIAIAPPALEFGDVVAESEMVMATFISNAGQAPLDVTLALEGGDGAFAIDVAELRIERDESAPVFVTFTPPTYLPYDAILIAESNDDDNARVEISLRGVGVYAPTPELCINPLAMDFGTVYEGHASVGIVYVENCGDAPFTVSNMAQTGSGAFTVDPQTDPTGSTVDGGDTQPVVVTYLPDNALGDYGTLLITTDIDIDETEIILIGNNGGDDFEYPVADIDCPGTSGPPVVVGLSGAGSHDPGGLEPLEYTWTLVDLPEGSAGGLSEFITMDTTLYTDIAGPYEVHLQVKNTAGVLSAPDKCIIDAVPEDKLHVELTWDTTGVDLDLHLLQSTSANFYDSPEDCSWCNSQPEWATASGADNPSLDLDDRSDGPENINILEPADGAYPVTVHYFDPLGGPATTATVRVYSEGVEIFTDSKVMTRDQIWEVGQVNWNLGSGSANSFGVYVAPVPLDTAPFRSCQN
jgi:hypothetical protein